MEAPHHRVQRLTPADASRYAELRHEMLLDTPAAFGSSPEDDRWRDVEQMRDTLGAAESSVLAIEQAGTGSRLIAAAGVVRETRAKRRHVAMIWGVYVAPAARGRGMGRAVVHAAIEVARAWPGVSRVQLCVSDPVVASGPSPARALYDSLGFVAWGVEPDALRTGGRSYAETHMSLRLRDAEG